eukprot:3103928-Rhodomonas_salina.3
MHSIIACGTHAWYWRSYQEELSAKEKELERVRSEIAADDVPTPCALATRCSVLRNSVYIAPYALPRRCPLLGSVSVPVQCPLLTVPVCSGCVLISGTEIGQYGTCGTALGRGGFAMGCAGLRWVVGQVLLRLRRQQANELVSSLSTSRRLRFLFGVWCLVLAFVGLLLGR